MIDQEEIHKHCLSDDPIERYEALNQLKDNFSQLPDKQQAWNDLHKLTNDQDSYVRRKAAFALGSIFSKVPGKQQAWNDLHRLTSDEDGYVRRKAAFALVSIYSEVPDKQQAWNDLIKLTNDEDCYVRSKAASALGPVFSEVPDKQQAWNDLIKLTSNEDSDVRMEVASVLGSIFPEVPDKQQAWNELHRLTIDEDSYVRREAASVLGSVFSHVPDKQQAWNDLIKLTNDKDIYVRRKAASALGSVFSDVPDKQRAWNDLIKLTSDKDSYVRVEAASVLGSVFSDVPDKQQAWNDLYRLTSDEDSDVRMGVVSVLGSIYSEVPDKQQAWNDLIKLTSDKDSYVRWGVASVLGSVYSHVPDKQQAWNELHRLTSDKDIYVRRRAAFALGSAFSHVPDILNAWNDLHRLTNDEDEWVRTYSNYSLGRVSIFMASQANKEEDYKKELEKAIAFFEKAAQESRGYNPAQFCLPFYRSFHTIIFKKQDAKEDMNRYLAETKEAVRGSKSKELLFEAVENLANALKEVENLGNLDLEAMQGELNFYRIYCDHATEFTRDAEETAPFAAMTMRKGMSILNRSLKELIEGIKKAAKTACKVSRGTDTEEIICVANKKVQKWEICTIEEIEFYAEDIFKYINSNVPKFPENKYIFEMIKEIEGKKDLKMLLKGIRDLFEELPKIMTDPERMKPTIGIITALPKEYAAVNVLLVNKNDKYTIPGSGAGRRYCLGEIFSEEGNKHNVVLAIAGMGNNIAATKAAILLEYFPNVKSIIMVGIAGGVPNPDDVDDHVRLGDIVVSNEYGEIQYDNIKKETQKTIFRNPPRPPCASLLEAVKYLEAGEILGNRPWEKYIDQALSIIKIIRPSEEKDILYCSDNQKLPVEHPKDPHRIKGQPRVFIGTIASANILQKNPKARDKLREKFKVKAIEMEASGIADATWNHEMGYLVIRGICDYCDTKKNDDWQPYAAVVAAAYTRALIESMP